MNQKLGRVEGRKAVVLFTDGVDTTSKRATYESTVQDAEELDALIYPVQYNTYRDMGGGVWPGNSSGDVWGQILGGIFGGPGGMRRGGRRGGAGTSRGEYALAGRYLTELAQRTGARQYEADTNQNLSYAFSNIADELRRQYSVGFYPKNPPQPGQRRQIRVRVNQPNLAVRSRDSYVFNPVGATNSPQDASTQKPPVLRKLAESTGNKPTSSH
jgi:VWFA-related protein